MRSRMVRPEFFGSEAVGSVDFGARILFVGLWCLADREGRVAWRAPVIHGALFPWDDKADVAGWLGQLTSAGLVKPYKSGKRAYVYIPGFEDHQRVHPREAPSEIPPYPGDGPRLLSGGQDRVRPEGSPRRALGDDQGATRQYIEVEVEVEAHSGPPLELATLLRESIQTHSPAYADRYPDRSRLFTGWVEAVEKLLRIDGAPPGEVEAVIRFAHESPEGTFWRSNLLSGKKLRQHFPKLRLQAAEHGKLRIGGPVVAQDWIDENQALLRRYMDRVRMAPDGPDGGLCTRGGLETEIKRAGLEAPGEDCLQGVVVWANERRKR